MINESSSEEVSKQSGRIFQLSAQLAACTCSLEEGGIMSTLKLYCSITARNFSRGVDLSGQLYLIIAAIERLAEKSNITSNPTNVTAIMAAAAVLAVCSNIPNNQAITSDVPPNSEQTLSLPETLKNHRIQQAAEMIGAILTIGATAAGTVLTIDKHLSMLALLSIFSATNPTKKSLNHIAKKLNPGKLKTILHNIIAFCQHNVIQALCRGALFGPQLSIATFTGINMYNANQTINYPHTEKICLAILLVGILWGFFVEWNKKTKPRLDYVTDIFGYGCRAIFGIFTGAMASVAVENPAILSSPIIFDQYQTEILATCIILIIISTFSYIQYSYYDVGLKKLKTEFNTENLNRIIDSCVFGQDLQKNIGKKTLIIILKTFAYLLYSILWMIVSVTGLGALQQGLEKSSTRQRSHENNNSLNTLLISNS